MAALADAFAAGEAALRLGAFFAVALAMAGWEALAPKRTLSVGRAGRWPANLGLALTGTVLVRLLFPAAVVATAATWAAAQGIGLLNVLAPPTAVAMAIALLALDLTIYGQHVLFHRVDALWRLHRVHHLDRDVDFTTGVRFHPVEIVVSVAIKCAAVAALGAPPAAVVVFEIVLNGSSMFNHGNVRLPAGLDRVLRALVVTPDMHRVHHSAIKIETDSNFGFCLSLWDRLFATYRAEPAAGHAAMTIGLPGWGAEDTQGFVTLLANPLRAHPAGDGARTP